jgi:tetratricopeptide (TPR) repeat protein
MKHPQKKAVILKKNNAKTVFAALIVLIIPVLLYIQTLTFGYTNFDDNIIIQNHFSFLKNFHNVFQAFYTDAFVHGDSRFYRPLQTLSYMVDIQLSGGDYPWMYHLTNIILTGLIACSLFYLLLEFSVPLKLAAIASMIYSVHPLFISSIAWIPSRGDLLLTLFSLLSFLLLIKFIRKKRIIYFFLHCITFILALFSKETAAILPALFILYYIFFISKENQEKRHILFLFFYGISGILWFWLRYTALHTRSNLEDVSGMFGQNEELGLMPLLKNLQAIPEALSNFFIPVKIELIPAFSIFKTISGFVIMALICVLFFKSDEKTKKVKLYSLAWFVLLLLPTMLYKHTMIDYLNHRFFLPMIGILLFSLILYKGEFQKNAGKYHSWLLIAIFITLSSVTFIKSRPYSDPITYYNSAISQDPHCALAYNNRGLAKNANELYDDAIADFSKAIEQDSTYAFAYNNLGLAFNNKKMYDQAIKNYRKAIRHEPKYTLAYNNLGWAFHNKQMFDTALAYYSKSIQLDPYFALAYINRGWTYYSQRAYDKAISDYLKAIENNPDYALAYNDLGMVYTDQGLIDNAIAEYSKAVIADSSFVFAHNNLGLMYNEKGLYDKAIINFTRAISLNPELASAYNDRGWAYYNLGFYDNAIADYTTAVNLDSNFVLAYNYRGLAFNNLGLFDRAIADYSKAIGIRPDYEMAYNNRGYANYNINEDDKAVSDYLKALELKPDFDMAFNNLEILYIRKGLYDRVISDYTKLIELRPDYAVAYFNRGIAYQRKGLTDQACRDFKKAETLGYLEASANISSYCK